MFFNNRMSDCKLNKFHMQSQRNSFRRCAAVLSVAVLTALVNTSSNAADAQNSKASDSPGSKAAAVAKDLPSAFVALGIVLPGPGKRILLDVPEIVDEKQNISIKVRSAIPNTEWIAVFIDKNATPFVGQFDLADKANSIEVEAKLMQTSSIVAIVRADGKYYRVDKQVKVAVAGGCE